MTSRQEEVALHHRLQEVLGGQHAATLWAMLPERSDLVTQEHLRMTEENLRSEITSVRDELRYEIGSVRDELRNDFGEFRTEMHKYVRSFVISQTMAIGVVAAIVFTLARIV